MDDSGSIVGSTRKSIMTGLKTNRYTTGRRVLIFAAIAGAIAIAVYWSHVRRQRTIAKGLAEIRKKVIRVNDTWIYPRPFNGLFVLLFNDKNEKPPDVFRYYSVILEASQIDDEMIAHLISIDRLRSLTIFGRSPLGFSAGPLPLKQLPLPASATAIAKLQEKYPALAVYVDPISEFESD